MNRIAATTIAIAVALFVSISPAVAQDQPEPTPIPSTTIPGGVDIGSGYSFTGATITNPGEPAPRSLDARQAATFVQSWLAWLYFGTPQAQSPPDGVPVSRVDVTGNWSDKGSGVVSVYYASDGTRVWISYPRDGHLNPDPNTPPPPDNWETAPDRVKDAFNGTAELVDTAGVVAATTPRSAAGVSSDNPSSSSASWPWVIVVAVVVVAVIALLVRRRRRRADSDSDSEPDVSEPATSRG